MGTKNNPGEYDCYENAEPDEPMFVLLARDPLAAQTVKYWADLRAIHMTHVHSIDPHEELKKIDEARDCAADMEAWKEDN